MRPLNFLSLVALPLLFFSCAGNNNNASSVNDKDGSKSLVAASAAARASFSCVIDGEAVSGDIVDEMQQYNAAYIMDVDQGKELLFKLCNIKTVDQNATFTRSLRFAIPNKTGSMFFGHDEDSWGIQVNIIPQSTGMAFATAQYNSDSITVNVTSLTPARVTGTFSGKFMLSPDTPKAEKKTIEITDGKFDIPMSTSPNAPV